jgi:tetratricopeptide (TPR) repeat protein
VAKLVIFRGDAHHADIQLPEHTVQIGRSPQNDIVLEDQGKGVSRTHAELRFEGGHHVLVDKGSQNGILVDGARVASVVLEPGVVASVGRYRLSVEGSEPPAELAAFEDPTEIGVRPGRQLPPAEESTARGPDESGGSVMQPIDGKGTASRAPSPKRRMPALATAAVLLVGAVGYGVYSAMRPPIPEPRADAWVAPATEMVNAGRCADALAQHIGPALARDLKDPAALQLKERCQQPPDPGTPKPEIPAGPTAAELLLNEADALLAGNEKPVNSNECQAALDKVNEVLAADPPNERGVALKKSAEGCLQLLAQAKRTPPAWIAPVDPEKGGLPPWAKESPQDHEARVRYAEAKYAEAQTRAAAGDYDDAEKALSGLPRNFKGVPELLESIGLAKNKRQAADLIVQARAAAGRDDFENATEWYRRAKELNPSFSIEKEIQDMDSRRLQLAQTKCNAAEARWVYRPSEETRRLYAEALKWLRPGEPCYAEALQRSK